MDLLVVDVVMPGVSGPGLAESLRVSRPSLKVLFISGYAAAGVAEHGVLNADTTLLQKPFTPDRLLSRVREILDEERR